MQIDPTSAGSLSAVSGLTPTTMESPPPTAFLGGTIDGIAGQVGMTTAQLRSTLAAGASLADIGQQQGVSRSSLVSSITQQVMSNRRNAGRPPIDPQQLDRAVNRAVDRGRRVAPPAPSSPGQFSGLIDQLG